MLATLFFSQGVRMLLGGDEIGRTQQGNNNAYCQDNEISWLNWNSDDAASDLLAYTRKLVGILNNNPVLRHRNFFTGLPFTPRGTRDVTWIRSDGAEMTEAEWSDGELRSIGMLVGSGDRRSRIRGGGRCAGTPSSSSSTAETAPGLSRCPGSSGPGSGRSS